MVILTVVLFVEQVLRLIGKQGRHEIRIEKHARLAGTIAYDFICGISNRVPRIYK